MLVSAKEMLDKAKAGHYAVGHFNINNLEWTKSILLACEEVKSPVILGVSEGAGKYMCGFETVTAMVDKVYFVSSSGDEFTCYSRCFRGCGKVYDRL